MTTNDDLMKKMNEHGEILARLDERTASIARFQEKHDNRLTYLERKDTIGTLVSSIIAGLSAGVALLHSLVGGPKP